ncbi:MAG: M60 family metallopeptidase, partial [Ureaplasma sp.]|nr:M60 family metallopeptidase [Ureaplasma sp.]
NDQNAIFTNKNNSSETINGYDVVMNERVTNEKGQYVNANNEVVTEDTQKIKYNDADWIINEIQRGTFKKHRAADKMYLNDMSKINSVVKEFTISTSTRGDLTLGLYVPAGEVVEITFSDETWELIKNRKNAVSFVINQNMWNNYPKGDSGRISTRYPYIETSFGANAIKGQSFQIGSPFGGGLSIFINSNILKPGDIPLYSQIQDVSFTVSGAIPCLYYEDGITKRDEWFNQIKKVQENKLAPILQAWSPYFSLTIPFNGLNRIGGKDINTLIYPNKSFKKWNDFLFLSNYLAGRDLSNSLTRLNMEFCDDVWGGAAAWGGGMTFYCPTSWANSIFGEEPSNVFNANNSWGVFHEINHNFEQNNAFFRRNTHGETNQVTAFNLSIISDITRFRNEINYTGENVSNNYNNGWCYLDT